nr:MAG TPA: hypothetical protein [Caudoviricetes sp.]
MSDEVCIFLAFTSFIIHSAAWILSEYLAFVMISEYVSTTIDNIILK